MKIQVLKCPNCNSSLEIENGIDTFYCKYCGYRIYMDDMSDASINAKVQIKEMAHREKMRDKQYEHERYKIEQKEKSKKMKSKREFLYSIFCIASIVLFFVFAGVYFISVKIESDNEEMELQITVENIIDDIANGNYREAYIKANTLYYTSGYSNEIEDKWNDTREALIKQIEKEEKASGEKSSNDNGEKENLLVVREKDYEVFVNGYEKAEYSKFNSLASENGLAGSKIYITGILERTEVLEANNTKTILGYLKDENEHTWLIMMHVIPIVTETHFDDAIGKNIVCNAVYDGYSRTKEMPAVILEELLIIENETTIYGMQKLLEEN